MVACTVSGVDHVHEELTELSRADLCVATPCNRKKSAARSHTNVLEGSSLCRASCMISCV
jgi:hypothetical protein